MYTDYIWKVCMPKNSHLPSVTFHVKHDIYKKIWKIEN